MRFISQDPDIETIQRRIEDADYDLQPDFQRGEVWTLQKKRRLIDSIIRGWHIPPIHLVTREDGRSDVLDGQQRLTAIRDFIDGDFPIDGNIEPVDEAIRTLNGLRYAQLPKDVGRKFRKFTIRVFELVDFDPEEPHELFFRLNQPTSLTEAEKRNAFIGQARNQIRELSDWGSQEGYLNESLGFSNARMAYHDMLARALVTVEARTLNSKVTASRVTARYRSGEPFSEHEVEAVRSAMEVTLTALSAEGLRPNKATLHSWLCAAAQVAATPYGGATMDVLPDVISDIEGARWNRPRNHAGPEQQAITVFQNRSTARVADVSSVVLRDLVIWMFISRTTSAPILEKAQLAAEALSLASDSDDFENDLLSFASKTGWGDLGWA